MNSNVSEDKEIRLLLVSDPQIVGYQYERFMFPEMARIDSYRFLLNGFKRAVRYSKPHYIIFVGDLFDEGEVASPEEMDDYKSKFNSIFFDNMPSNAKILVVPGDNDVGGGGAVYRTRELQSRFENMFHKQYPSIFRSQHVNFILGDVWNKYSADKLRNLIRNNSGILKSKINILVNHIDYNLEQYQQWGPLSVIITGHTHLSNWGLCKNCNIFAQKNAAPISNSSYLHKKPMSSDNPEYYHAMYSDGGDLYQYESIKVDLKHSVGSGGSGSTSQILRDCLEISVPTCSYRLGVPNVGYGLMKLHISDSHAYVTYKLLWLPYRFTCLYLYLLIIPTCILITLFQILQYVRNNRSKHISRSRSPGKVAHAV